MTAPEDVDPKALEIAQSFVGIGRPFERRDLARHITALLRERDEANSRLVRVLEHHERAQKERADVAEAKLRERDEEIEHRDMWAALWKRAEAAEERAQKAEAALAKKDEALREIIAVIQRTYGSDPSQRGVSKNRIERIAKGGLGE